MSKILYLVPGCMDEKELARRHDIAQTMLINPSNQVDFIASKNGPVSIESAVEEAMSVQAMIETYLTLDDEYSAVVVGCAGDPGITALRELLDIPVIGPFQSSAALATTLGHSFGVVSILSEVDPETIMQVRGMGYSSLFSGVQSIDCKVLDMTSGATSEDDVADAVEKAVLALEKNGAASAVLGCMTLAFLLIDEKLKNRVSIPIINPAKTAINTAELLIAAKLCHSKQTYPRPDMKKLRSTILH